MDQFRKCGFPHPCGYYKRLFKSLIKLVENPISINIRNNIYMKYIKNTCSKKTHRSPSRDLHMLVRLANNSTKVTSFAQGLRWIKHLLQVNLDMTDSMGPGKLVRHMQNPSYTYGKYLICMGLGPSILSVIDE